MKDGAAPLDTGGTQAVARALSLLSLVGRGGAQGLGLAQIAAASGLARPAADGREERDAGHFRIGHFGIRHFETGHFRRAPRPAVDRLPVNPVLR